MLQAADVSSSSWGVSRPTVPRPPTVLSQTACGLLSHGSRPPTVPTTTNRQLVPFMYQSVSAPLMETSFAQSSKPGRPHERRISSEFRESHKHHSKQLQQERGARSSVGRADGGPSTPAQRENFKREHYATQIERGEEASSSSARGKFGRSCGGFSQARGKQKGRDALESLVDNNDSVDQMAETFHASIKEVDIRLEDLSKGLRDDSTNEEKVERERREAERKRREMEVKRARKREQDARDPHLKVALRLEQKRQFEQGNPDMPSGPGIPMQKIDILGAQGREQLSLVDVRVLRARCQQLDEGASVESLIHLQRQREHQVQLSARQSALSSQRESCSSLPELLCYQERRQRVINQKEAKRLGTVLHRMNNMRSEIPENLPCSFESLQRHLAKEKQREVSGESEGQLISQQVTTRFADADGSFSSSLRKSPTSETGGGSTITSFPSSPARSVTTKAKGLGAFRSRAAVIGKLKHNQRKDQVADIARECRQRRLAVFRGSARFLMVLFKVRSQNRRMGIVKIVLSDIGEWARIKLAVHKLIGAVKILQIKSREFLALKRKRLELMQKDWMRVEDTNLEIFFKQYADNVMSEKFGSAEGHGQSCRATPGSRREASHLKQEFYRKLQEGVKDGLLMIDWRTFRIPGKDRRDVLGRYYSALLRKRVRSQSSIITVAHEVVRSQRELVGFLAKFGASVSPTTYFFDSAEVQNTVAPPPFWHTSEDMLLKLIAIAAQSLVDVDPFREHPANRNIPGNPMYRKPLGKGGHDAEDIAAQVGRLTQRSDEPLKRLSKERHSAGRVSVALPEGNEDRRNDLEDIFRSFTPRMREINEEQTVEYQMDITSAETPTVPQ